MEMPSIESAKNIGPRRFEAPAQSVKIVDGHVPLARFDPLQGAAINIRPFSQLLLGELCTISEPIDVSTYGNMYLGRSNHL
jgi:hypothetical protein